MFGSHVPFKGKLDPLSHEVLQQDSNIWKQNVSTRWVKVTFWSPSWRSLNLFWSPSWRSLNLWKGHLTIPKRSQRIARQKMISVQALQRAKRLDRSDPECQTSRPTVGPQGWGPHQKTHYGEAKNKQRWKNQKCCNDWSSTIYGTQMTIVLIGKGLCFGGLTSKNRGHLGSGNYILTSRVNKTWTLGCRLIFLVWVILGKVLGMIFSEDYGLKYLNTWKKKSWWCCYCKADHPEVKRPKGMFHMFNHNQQPSFCGADRTALARIQTMEGP